MMWRSIDTAPKDGKRFIAWGPFMRVAECEWREAWYQHPEGWYRSNQHPVVQPTHWMPLPDPPTLGEGTPSHAEILSDGEGKADASAHHSSSSSPPDLSALIVTDEEK